MNINFMTLSFAFLLGFMFGVLVIFPFECETCDTEVLNNCSETEVFIVKNFSVVDGYYYADIDNMRRFEGEFEERPAVAD